MVDTTQPICFIIYYQNPFTNLQLDIGLVIFYYHISLVSLNLLAQLEACERLLEYVVDEDKNTVESEITEVFEIRTLLEQNHANSTT
jgi:hypothetical protein